MFFSTLKIFCSKIMHICPIFSFDECVCVFCGVRSASLVAEPVKNLSAMQGNAGLIHGSGRSTGEEIGYLLQYSWASLVVQLVKNLPPRWETWILSLAWEDSLEEGIATHSSILAWRIPMDRGACQATDYGVTESQTRLSN